ncbi:cytochrome-c peroxidase [Xanthocytophaga flava]|uniref:cytochrome-c peroxidase n=1 Tax=Xanthocytophaga flava TaxID=3048013 RepID=UPI0028D781B5|nr:cytochrome c peroxidase [Xanthocytophaga flavus]MDJ1473079.1 cytochrome c peroxidase [Xanthocytophaga flavus]
MKKVLIEMGIVALTALVWAMHLNKPENTTPTTLIKERYLTDIQALDTAVKLLHQTVEQDKPVPEIQNAFKLARLQFKKLEYLAEYYNPYTTQFINGAPIAEWEVYDAKLIDPEGFQVIENYLFPTYTKQQKAEAILEIKKLLATFNRLKSVSPDTNPTDSHVFDAMRLEIFRMVTLGITGFDSPIANTSLPEAVTTLTTLQDITSLYLENLEEKNPELATQVRQAFTESIGYLQKHPDFNSFDRLTFIADHANRLSGLLLDMQQALQIPVFQEKRLLRPDARHLFELTAFNPDYYTPSYDAALTQERIQLGERLFFETALSGNKQRNCATCHQPSRAFTDGLPKSLAMDNKHFVARNAPTLINAALQQVQFYDSRSTSLEDQASDVITNKDEMHGSLDESIHYLQSSPEYSSHFQKAFPKDATPVNQRNLKVALASYTRSLTHFNSRFDRYMRGEKHLLTSEEKNGFNLFTGKAKCGTCHFIPLFNGTVPPSFHKTESEVLGVPASVNSRKIDPDLGRYVTTHSDTHKNAFKTTTIRNIEYTAPYMHNGIYKTLEEVVDFYNKGGGAGIGIDVPNQTLSPDQLSLTEKEKKELIAFMMTLSDVPQSTNTIARSE